MLRFGDSFNRSEEKWAQKSSPKMSALAQFRRFAPITSAAFCVPSSCSTRASNSRRATIDAAKLRSVEDEAIRGVVKFQEDLGLRGITDGEFRRTYFHIDFLTQLDGVETKGGIAVSFHSAAGNVDFAPPVMQVTGKVRHAKPIQLADFEFLKSVTTRTPKVTIPSPTMLHFRGGRDAISREAYPDIDAFYADVAAAYADELQALGAAGCTYVQLDDTNLAYLCDEKMREGARRAATIPTSCRAATRGSSTPPSPTARPGMTVCVHLCRGNFKSAWAAEGGYEPVAEVLFNELAVDGYFLEYDDARSGDFAPLRHVPKGKTVVLGLVSTKVGQLESKDDLKRRIDEAAKLVPLEQLCLSPQCGFSSTVHGNDIAMESQAAKLRLVVETARDVWGAV